MIDIRSSTARKPNPHLKELSRSAAQTNSQWLARALDGHQTAGAIVLLGGTGPVDFRLRVAQSRARGDLLPGFWSHAVLLRRAAGKSDWSLYEASLEPRSGFGAVPANNGVQEARFSAYDDPVRYPNIACLEVRLRPAALRAGLTFSQAVEDAVGTFRRQRSLVDLGELLVEWLGFAWGVREAGNPLLKGRGIPSAVLVESVFSMVGVELTPGLASHSSCPEAIWQAAKWWHEFYESEASMTEAPLTGSYAIGQPAAAVVEGEAPAARRRGQRG